MFDCAVPLRKVDASRLDGVCYFFKKKWDGFLRRSSQALSSSNSFASASSPSTLTSGDPAGQKFRERKVSMFEMHPGVRVSLQDLHRFREEKEVCVELEDRVFTIDVMSCGELVEEKRETLINHIHLELDTLEPRRPHHSSESPLRAKSVNSSSYPDLYTPTMSAVQGSTIIFTPTMTDDGKEPHTTLAEHGELDYKALKYQRSLQAQEKMWRFKREWAATQTGMANMGEKEISDALQKAEMLDHFQINGTDERYHVFVDEDERGFLEDWSF